MDKNLSALTHLPYAVEVVPDATTDGGVCYLAQHPELPGCMAHGDTPEEALENLEEARSLYIRTLLERGIEVPLPQSTTLTTSIPRQEVIWIQQPDQATGPGALTEAAFLPAG